MKFVVCLSLNEFMNANYFYVIFIPIRSKTLWTVLCLRMKPTYQPCVRSVYTLACCYAEVM